MEKYQFQLPAIPFYVPAFIDKLVIAIVLRYRKIRFGFPFRRIKLTPGKYGRKYALVDPEDYEKLNKYRWYAARCLHTFYAQGKRYGKTVKMHRQIINPPPDFFVDHINHDGLDNRRANLRLATPEQNSHNKRKERGILTSKYKGVYRSKKTNKWFASIRHKGKLIQISRFDNEIDAAKAYDAAAKLYYGDFASLNFE